MAALDEEVGEDLVEGGEGCGEVGRVGAVGGEEVVEVGGVEG